MNQRVGIDVQANVQGVQQATNTTAAGVDNIGKAADRASARIKQLEKNVQALIQRLEQLGKAGGKGFNVPGQVVPGAPSVPPVPAGPPGPVPPPSIPQAPRVPARVPSHTQQGRGAYGYNFGRFAHAGINQSLHGLGQMAGTPGAASVLSGGLRFGLQGMLFAGLAASISSLVKGHEIATQEAHSIDFLKRQLGDIGVNFNTLRDMNRGASAGYGLSSVESASYARQFARGGNMRGMDGLQGELRNAYGFSRAYGMDPGAGVGFFSAMRGLRVTIDETSSKKLGAILAESLEKGGNVAQAQEVMAAVQQFATSMARQTLTMPNMEAFAGGISSLTRLKLPGLDAQGAGSLLMQADQAMRQGGAKGEASLNVAYAALAKANPGISAFGAKALMGMGLFGTGSDLAASPWGKMTGFKGSGGTSNFDAVRGMIQKHYGGNPEVLAASLQGFFGLNEQQAAVMAGFSPDQLGGIEALTKRRGIDFGKINSAGMQSLASVAAARNMGDLVPTIRSVRDRKDIGAADRAALKEALDSGDFGKVQDTLTDILSRADQEMSDGKKSLEVQKQMETALARLGDGLLPATNMIRDGVGRLVNVFAGGSDEANAYNAERKRQQDAADMEDFMKKQVERGNLSPAAADRALDRTTGWKGAGVDDSLLDAVRKVESGGNRFAVSGAGAKGPYQLMDGTAKRFGVSDPFDEGQSRGAARKYLSLLHSRYNGNMQHALMAYNWGEGNLDAWLKTGRGAKGQAMPMETQQYADKVLKQMGGNVADYDSGAAGRRASAGKPDPVDVRSTVEVTLRDPQGRQIAPMAVTQGRRVPVPAGAS